MINKINKLVKNIFSRLNYEIIDEYLLDKKNINKIKNFLETLYLNRFYKKKALKTPTNKKVLILAPHPDDEVLGCGGLLLSLIKNHCEVNIFCLTSGKKNEQKLREKEFKSIWDKNKIKHYIFFRFKDKELFKKIKDIKTVRNKIIDYKPDIILTPFILDDHIDHVNTSKVFLKLSKELIKTKIWCYQVYSSIFSNYYFDITQIQKNKFKLMKKYKSQILNFDYINWNRGLNAWNSRFANKKKIKFVENYYISSFENYSKISKNYFSKKIK